MNFKIIDAHTHIQFEQYDKDRPETIERAFLSGVGMIIAGADLKSSQEAVNLASQYKNGIWAAVGIHPTELKDFDEFEKIKNLSKNEKVVGIGECGIDLYRDEDKKNYEKQKELFEKHILLSNEIKKPLVIHCRQAFFETLSILKENKNELISEPGVLHFFTGSLDEAKEFLSLNFSFTFGGLITANRSLDKVIEYIPLEKILVETDAPFVSPKSHKKERNEPAFIEEVVETIAFLKNRGIQEVKSIILSNTKRVFNLDKFFK